MPQLFPSFPLTLCLGCVPAASGRRLCLTLGRFKFRSAAHPSLCHAFPRVSTLGAAGHACHSPALIGMPVKFLDRVHTQAPWTFAPSTSQLRDLGAGSGRFTYKTCEFKRGKPRPRRPRQRGYSRRLRCGGRRARHRPHLPQCHRANRPAPGWPIPRTAGFPATQLPICLPAPAQGNVRQHRLIGR
jgi:hypothetical protein